MRDFLRYHWNVNIIGRPALRLNRWYTQLRAGQRWKSEVLTPPLNITARVKELIALHYLKGRYADSVGKVAWVTSGAPIEFLKALGFYTVYPENHAAVCGTMRKAVEISCEAEKAGYSCDICSYARTDIGTMLSGKTPVGRLPRPDLLLACTNICQTVLYWYRVLAHHFKVPLLLIDTPFVYTEPTPHAISYVTRQIEEAVPLAEKVAGRSLSMGKLKEVMRLSREASELWLEIIERGQHRPAPISVFDQFILMAPIVEMRGDVATVDFYKAMLREMDKRISQGIGVVRKEKKRLLWDNLPLWYRLRYLAEFLGSRGAVTVVSTYTNAWGELAHLIVPEHPFEAMARTYIYPILNRGTGDKLRTIEQMIQNYSVDGVILHSDRSCKPYSIGQITQRERLIHEHKIPALLLEADHSDFRSFSEDEAAHRLAAFLEMLEI